MQELAQYAPELNMNEEVETFMLILNHVLSLPIGKIEVTHTPASVNETCVTIQPHYTVLVKDTKQKKESGHLIWIGMGDNSEERFTIYPTTAMLTKVDPFPCQAYTIHSAKLQELTRITQIYKLRERTKELCESLEIERLVKIQQITK